MLIPIIIIMMMMMIVLVVIMITNSTVIIIYNKIIITTIIIIVILIAKVIYIDLWLGQKMKAGINTEKGKVLHFGNKNSSQDYMKNGSVLGSSNVEKDLGVMTSNVLKYSSYIDFIVLKADRLAVFGLR